MKVLGVVCSPRKGGNTEILMQEALAVAGEMGAETELLTIRDLDIKPCDACGTCSTGECHIQDDMYVVYKKLLEADGIILGTPIYFWSMCGQAKVLLERTMPLRHPDLKLTDKVGGAIAVHGRVGAVNALNIFHRFFLSNHMFPAGRGVIGLAGKKGEIRKDEYAMKSARELGRQVILFIKQQLKFPKE